MWRHLGEALWEWVAGILIGAIPLGTHAIAYFCFKDATNHALGWTADILFLVIATAGTSAVQTGFKLAGPLKAIETGRAPVTLIASSIVVLVLAAFLYGAYVSGQTDPDTSLKAALWMFAGALMTSLATELVIAQRFAAAAKLSPRR